jgi:hypothetical protein
MLRLFATTVVIASCLLAACGGSSSSSSSTPATSETSAAAATTTAPEATCSDADITTVVQQAIGTLNDLQTDITPVWFVSQAKQDAGVAAVTSEIKQMHLQTETLKVCKTLSADQAKIVVSTYRALAVGTEFAETTLGLVKSKSLKVDIDTLKKAEAQMNDLTLRANQAFAELSTGWEAWKGKTKASA